MLNFKHYPKLLVAGEFNRYVASATRLSVGFSREVFSYVGRWLAYRRWQLHLVRNLLAIAPQREITNHWSGLKSDILVIGKSYLSRSIQPLCCQRQGYA